MTDIGKNVMCYFESYALSLDRNSRAKILIPIPEQEVKAMNITLVLRLRCHPYIFKKLSVGMLEFGYQHTFYDSCGRNTSAKADLAHE